MTVTIKGSAKEIAALAAETRERQIRAYEHDGAMAAAREARALKKIIRRLEKSAAGKAVDVATGLPKSFGRASATMTGLPIISQGINTARVSTAYHCPYEEDQVRLPGHKRHD